MQQELLYNIPSYYSPSSCSKFYQDRAEYYLMYLAKTRAPRMKSTPAMNLGNVYDSLVTHAIAVMFYGLSDVRTQTEFSMETLMEACHEDHLDMDEQLAIAQDIFNQYKATGGFAALCAELRQADPGSIKMQQKSYYNSPKGYTLFGYMDISFTIGDVLVVRDFKLNGYFSKAGITLIKNYIDAFPKDVKRVKYPHKDVFLSKHVCGLQFAFGCASKAIPQYARQLATYGWALNGNKAPVENLLLGIEQVSCKRGSNRVPEIMFARTSNFIKPDAQLQLLKEYDFMHETIISGHIFDDLTREESDAKCVELNNLALGMQDDGSGFNDLIGR